MTVLASEGEPLAAALLRTLELPATWHGLVSPGLWLLVAAVFFTRGRPARPSLAKVWRSWLQVAPVTALFIVLGVLGYFGGNLVHLAGELIELLHHGVALIHRLLRGAGAVMDLLHLVDHPLQTLRHRR